jgi:hypothetical protein
MALGGAIVEAVGIRYAFATGAAIVGAMALLALTISPQSAAAQARAND